MDISLWCRQPNSCCSRPGLNGSPSPEIWWQRWEHFKSSGNVEEHRQGEGGSQVPAPGMRSLEQDIFKIGLRYHHLLQGVHHSKEHVTYTCVYIVSSSHRKSTANSLPCRPISIIVRKTDRLWVSSSIKRPN